MFATARQILEEEKESLFIKFQQNNRPSGLSYIKAHCVDYLFEAMKDNILANPEDDKVVVKSIEANIIDYDDSNGTKIASVHYTCVISTNGQEDDIDEFWHFKYTGWNWHLTGIEQV
jgi:predicted lipid-binding transport protein (Tim44 family)